MNICKEMDWGKNEKVSFRKFQFQEVPLFFEEAVSSMNLKH
jgi:hypothetical protein